MVDSSVEIFTVKAKREIWMGFLNDKVSFYDEHSQSEPQRHHKVTKRLLIDFILAVD